MLKCRFPTQKEMVPMIMNQFIYLYTCGGGGGGGGGDDD